MRAILFSTTAALTALTVWTSAHAADLPKAPPPSPAPVFVPPAFTWTGFYLGGNFGGGWSSTTFTDNLTGGAVTATNAGWLGGGQVGFNYQFGAAVVGVEATFDWSSLGVNPPAWTVAGLTSTASLSTKWVTTAAARLGYAADRALFYGKAGGGWVGNSATISTSTGASLTTSNTNSGWLVGGGLEYAFTPNWTGKLEYDYLGLQGWTATSPIVADSVNVKRQLNIFTVGFNYKL
jgi:outer membrane immunogenic protein